MNATDTLDIDTEYADLKAVYMATYAGFGVTPADLADSLPGVNQKYARRLLGILINSGLVVESDSNGEAVWQTIPTYDDMDDTEAENKFHDTFGTGPGTATDAATPTARPRSAKAKHDTFHPCYCGCDENVPSKSFYRPGHDARHAGVIGRQIAANYATPGFDRRELLNELPSDRLKGKAEGIAEKQIEKIEAKAAKAAPTWEDGKITMGKTVRDARRSSKGEVEYLDNRGDWREASATASKTFEVNA